MVRTLPHKWTKNFAAQLLINTRLCIGHCTRLNKQVMVLDEVTSWWSDVLWKYNLPWKYNLYNVCTTKGLQWKLGPLNTAHCTSSRPTLCALLCIVGLFSSNKISKTISLYNKPYNNIPFIFECFYDKQHAHWRKKASRKYQTRKSPDSQIGSLSFFFFFFFRQASSKLHDAFTTVFTQNSSINTLRF